MKVLIAVQSMLPGETIERPGKEPRVRQPRVLGTEHHVIEARGIDDNLIAEAKEQLELLLVKLRDKK